MVSTPISRLTAYDKQEKAWNVVIETPRGCRTKYKYDTKTGVFKISTVLPAGSTFPYDFGFIPGTIGADGDPLDVLLMMDEPVFAGCLVCARLIGVIEAEQTERDAKAERNDRLIAVAAKSRDCQDILSIKDMHKTAIAEIEHFFISYNKINGKKFKPLGRFGPNRAEKLVNKGMRKK